MHAILVGRKIYALDMPSNFIFTHWRWLLLARFIVSVTGSLLEGMSNTVMLL